MNTRVLHHTYRTVRTDGEGCDSETHFQPDLPRESTKSTRENDWTKIHLPLRP